MRPQTSMRPLCDAGRLALLLLALILLALLGPAMRPAAAEPGQAPPDRIPDLFAPDHYIPRPDMSAIRAVRFLTTDDFPPFHFALPNGTLVGFDVDLARAICRDLKLACTIQARRFDSVLGEIKAGHDDAVVAAIANTPASRADLDFTAPYYTTPARFVAKLRSKLDAGSRMAGSGMEAVTPEALAGHSVGVEAGTAHEAYLKAFFPKALLRAYPSQAELRAALLADKIEIAFADGIGLAAWLNAAESQGCCGFRGGAFTETRFFGNGVSIAVAKGNTGLRQAFDYELAKLAHDGTYADLYLKYFPISFY